MGVQPRSPRDRDREMDREMVRETWLGLTETGATICYWVGIVWGWLALFTGLSLLLSEPAVAAVQLTVAVALLIGLPFGRAYRRRKAYHRELLERANEL